MFESLVSCLIKKMGSLLKEEVIMLNGVDGKIRDMMSELESMTTFIREADKRADDDASLKTWLKQVREVATDIEDVLDKFILSAGLSKAKGITYYIQHGVHVVRNTNVYHPVGVELQRLQAAVHDINERRMRYAFGPIRQDNGELDEDHSCSLFVKEAEIVGGDTARDELIQWLGDGGDLSRCVKWVVGLGGLGKSTLAKRVYGSDKAKDFKHHAWITINPQTKLSEFLQSLIKQLYEGSNKPLPEKLETVKSAKLIDLIQSFLHNEKEKYIVVLDNLHAQDIWESMERALIDNEQGSRIIVTTRREDMADSCADDPEDVYPLHPLSRGESWSLFCTKAFRGPCPQDLERVSKKFVDWCGGMPLALTVVAGFLPKAKKNRTEAIWQQYYDRLSFDLRNNERLKKMSNRILMLGYNELHYYLKPCFLYFGLFPKGYCIKRTKLVRLWIGEGFIENDDKISPEDLAEGHLNELVGRNMVQAISLDSCGRVRSCKVHDLVWEIVHRKCKEDNFTSSLEKKKEGSAEKPRRSSIQTGVQNVDTTADLSQLRSAFLFGQGKIHESSVDALFSGFSLLKVLDLEDAPIEVFPRQIVDLFFLRYLSLRNTKIRHLPKTLSKLKNLETLDLRRTLVSELPKEIYKLENLRHLFVCRHYIDEMKSSSGIKIGVKLPAGIKKLTSLQKLSCVDVSKTEGLVIEFWLLAQLKKIALTGLRKGDGRGLCSSIQLMNRLQSIDLSSADGEFLDLDALSSPPPMLQRLYLTGGLGELPLWVLKAQHLVKLSLTGSRLKDDPFGSLQYLSNLVELCLTEAYEGKMLHCNHNGFQMLRVLELDRLGNLQEIKLVKGALPNLRRLAIQRCASLKKVPVGLEHLANVKDFYSIGMPANYSDEVRAALQRKQKAEKVVHVQKKQRSPVGMYDVLLDLDDM